MSKERERKKKDVSFCLHAKILKIMIYCSILNMEYSHAYKMNHIRVHIFSQNTFVHFVKRKKMHYEKPDGKALPRIVVYILVLWFVLVWSIICAKVDWRSGNAFWHLKNLLRLSLKECSRLRSVKMVLTAVRWRENYFDGRNGKTIQVSIHSFFTNKTRMRSVTVFVRIYSIAYLYRLWNVWLLSICAHE